MKPTKKWWAAFSGAMASVAASWITSGNFDATERGMLATAIVSLTAAYWKTDGQT